MAGNSMQGFVSEKDMEDIIRQEKEEVIEQYKRKIVAEIMRHYDCSKYHRIGTGGNKATCLDVVIKNLGLSKLVEEWRKTFEENPAVISDMPTALKEPKGRESSDMCATDRYRNRHELFDEVWKEFGKTFYETDELAYFYFCRGMMVFDDIYKEHMKKYHGRKD